MWGRLNAILLAQDNMDEISNLKEDVDLDLEVLQNTIALKDDSPFRISLNVLQGVARGSSRNNKFLS